MEAQDKLDDIKMHKLKSHALNLRKHVIELSSKEYYSKFDLDYGDYSKELNKCIKLWPQFYGTEGFFIAKIRK